MKLLPLTFQFLTTEISIRVLLATYCNFPLGMESGHIRNDMINASSYFVFHDVFMPHQARLNGLSAWSSLKSDAFQILEV